METLVVQSQLLKAIIKDVFGVDVMDKSRKREIVDARYVYAKILLDEGHSLVAIGNSMKKHHSTIIHYMQQSEFALYNIRELNNKYNLVKTKFTGIELPEQKFYTRRQLMTQIKELENELDLLRTFKVQHEIINGIYES